MQVRVRIARVAREGGGELLDRLRLPPLLLQAVAERAVRRRGARLDEERLPVPRGGPGVVLPAQQPLRLALEPVVLLLQRLPCHGGDRPPPLRLDREPRPVADDGHAPVQVRPVDRAVERHEPIQHLPVRKTEAVPLADADDRDLRPHRPEERVGAGGATAVVPDLEHLAPQIAAGGEDRLLLLVLAVPGEEERGLPEGHADHERVVVVVVGGDPARPRALHHRRRGAPAPIERLPAADDTEARARGFHRLEKFPVRLRGMRETVGDELVRRHRFEDFGETAVMVAVLVGQDHGVEMRHPAPFQVGEHDRPALRPEAPVDEHAPLRRLHDDRIADAAAPPAPLEAAEVLVGLRARPAPVPFPGHVEERHPHLSPGNARLADGGEGEKAARQEQDERISSHRLRSLRRKARGNARSRRGVRRSP